MSCVKISGNLYFHKKKCYPIKRVWKISWCRKDPTYERVISIWKCEFFFTFLPYTRYGTRLKIELSLKFEKNIWFFVWCSNFNEFLIMTKNQREKSEKCAHAIRILFIHRIIFSFLHVCLKISYIKWSYSSITSTISKEKQVWNLYHCCVWLPYAKMSNWFGRDNQNITLEHKLWDGAISDHRFCLSVKKNYSIYFCTIFILIEKNTCFEILWK